MPCTRGRCWGEEAGQTAGSCHFYSRLLFHLPLLTSEPSECKLESGEGLWIAFPPLFSPQPHDRGASWEPKPVTKGFISGEACRWVSSRLTSRHPSISKVHYWECRGARSCKSAIQLNWVAILGADNLFSEDSQIPFFFILAAAGTDPGMCWIFWEGRGVLQRRETLEGGEPLKIRKLVVYFEKPTRSHLPEVLEGV